jgi:hypothetical protein
MMRFLVVFLETGGQRRFNDCQVILAHPMFQLGSCAQNTRTTVVSKALFFGRVKHVLKYSEHYSMAQSIEVCLYFTLLKFVAINVTCSA